MCNLEPTRFHSPPNPTSHSLPPLRRGIHHPNPVPPAQQGRSTSFAGFPLIDVTSVVPVRRDGRLRGATVWLNGMVAVLVCPRSLKCWLTTTARLPGPQATCEHWGEKGVGVRWEAE